VTLNRVRSREMRSSCESAWLKASAMRPYVPSQSVGKRTEKLPSRNDSMADISRRARPASSAGVVKPLPLLGAVEGVFLLPGRAICGWDMYCTREMLMERRSRVGLDQKRKGGSSESLPVRARRLRKRNRAPGLHHMAYLGCGIVLQHCATT